MPDPEGPTRWRVLVGFELEAETAADAYAHVSALVAARNAQRPDAGLTLTVGHITDVLPVAGSLAPEERARIAAAEAGRVS